MASGEDGIVSSDWKHLAAKMMIKTSEVNKSTVTINRLVVEQGSKEDGGRGGV